MDELMIYAYQAKCIENTLRIVSNTLNCYRKETCLDRQVVKASQMIQEVLNNGKKADQNKMINKEVQEKKLTEICRKLAEEIYNTPSHPMRGGQHWDIGDDRREINNLTIKIEKVAKESCDMAIRQALKLD